MLVTRQISKLGGNTTDKLAMMKVIKFIIIFICTSLQKSKCYREETLTQSKKQRKKLNELYKEHIGQVRRQLGSS